MKISAIKTSVIVASILTLVFPVMLFGCSSSQPPTVPSAAASSPVTNDAEVNTILQKSCYQCHSTGGSAPWYAAVSPYYLAANSARNALNFSDWPSYDAAKRAEELKSIEAAVSGGTMPPSSYTALDHSASLNEDQKQNLVKWAAEPAH